MAYCDRGGNSRYLRVEGIADPCELDLLMLGVHHTLRAPASNAGEDDRAVECDTGSGIASGVLRAGPGVGGVETVSSGVVSLFVKSCLRYRPSYGKLRDPVGTVSEGRTAHDHMRHLSNLVRRTVASTLIP